MKKNFKKALEEAFEPPVSTGKKDFLKRLPQPEISTPSFVLAQAEYIPNYVWGSSVLIFGVALAGGGFLERDILWIISALIPFAAVSVITERIRSDVHLMSELEMAARFSLRSVTLARMGILGVLHMGLLLFLIPLSALYNVASVFQTAVYLLVPYLMTVTIGLWTARKIRGMDSMYACLGIAVAVSGSSLFVRNIYPVVYEAEYTLYWALAVIILIALTTKELKKEIKQTEELAWN